MYRYIVTMYLNILDYIVTIMATLFLSESILYTSEVERAVCFVA